MRRCLLAALVLSVTPVAQARAADTVPFQRAQLGLANATDLGAAPAAKVLTVGVSLKRPDPAGEDAALKAMYDPSSAEYHRFLTPTSFAARFGVSAIETNALKAWMTSSGLALGQVSGAGDFVAARGTVAQVERLFGTEIDRYTAKGVSFLANRTAPQVPAALPVTAVLGLNTLQGAHTMQSGGPDVPTTLTPQDLWSIYKQPSGTTGKGQKIAIMVMGKQDGVITDLRKYESEMKLPTADVQVKPAIAGGDYSDDSGHGEWVLDTQSSSGMAPDTSGLVLYAGQTLTDVDQAAAFSAWVNDPDGPQQANASFGECETTPANSTPENPALDPINVSNNPSPGVGTNAPNMVEPASEPTLKQGVMEGRTLFASTGDTGSSCPAVVLGPLGAANGVANEGVPLVNYPAASPYAVAVGGTVVYKSGDNPPQRSVEYAWPYTGGGQSFFLTAPDYQQGVTNLDRTCISDPDGGASNQGKLCRGIPDVAAESGDIATSAYAIVDDGQDSASGGTSLSSPLWAGMWSRIQSGIGGGAGGAGFANEDLYKIGKNDAARARDYYDITVGSNGYYQTQNGWDYVSGWGAPNVTDLGKDVATLTPQNGQPAGTLPAATAAPGCTMRPYVVTQHKGLRVGRKHMRIAGTVKRRCTAKITAVNVTVARRLGKQCRYLLPTGTLAPKTSCARIVLLPARGTDRFSVRLRKAIPAGQYVIRVFATDASGRTSPARRLYVKRRKRA